MISEDKPGFRSSQWRLITDFGKTSFGSFCVCGCGTSARTNEQNQPEDVVSANTTELVQIGCLSGGLEQLATTSCSPGMINIGSYRRLPVLELLASDLAFLEPFRTKIHNLVNFLSGNAQITFSHSLMTRK